MKANEIMIGDLLRVTKDVCIKKGTIVRVTAIDAYESLAKRGLKGSTHCVDVNDMYNNGGVWAAYLEAIELSGEIFEKLGFKRHWITEKGSTREEWRLSDDYYDIVVYEWSDSIWVFRYESCEMNTPHEQRTMSYLHQLQHAFHDCGIDKQITI